MLIFSSQTDFTGSNLDISFTLSNIFESVGSTLTSTVDVTKVGRFNRGRFG